MDGIRALVMFAGVVCTLGLVQGDLSLKHLFSLDLPREVDPFHDECDASPETREGCGRNYDTLGKWQCRARGCCWDERNHLDTGNIHCFLGARMLNPAPECAVHYKEKDDCGYYDMIEGECLRLGCCWRPSNRVNDPNCYKKKEIVLTPETTTLPSIDNLRLMDDGTVSDKQGRVEVFFNNEWGTVCDDGFGIEEANVICRQLGYAFGQPKHEAFFGEGSGQIWLDEMYCTGSENSLFDCDHPQWGQHDCSHYEDAGVVCYSEGEEPENQGYTYNDQDTYWDEVESMSRLKPFNKGA